MGIRRIFTALMKKDPMIFGFNTDVKHADNVYHVQSEARQSECLFQTQVFVRGRCIGKRATSYQDKAPDPFFTDKQKEAMLRDQHRYVLDAIREGRLEEVLDRRDTPETLAGIKRLDLLWINADSVYVNGGLVMKVKVIEGDTAVPGAKLTSRFARADEEPRYWQAISDTSGVAEIRLELEESALADTFILIQADYNDRTATKKFRLKKVTG